jgi:hypothetical protein
VIHPNEIDLMRLTKNERKALGEWARTKGRAYAEAWNEQVNRQALYYTATTKEQEAA